MQRNGEQIRSSWPSRMRNNVTDESIDYQSCPGENAQKHVHTHYFIIRNRSRSALTKRSHEKLFSRSFQALKEMRKRRTYWCGILRFHAVTQDRIFKNTRTSRISAPAPAGPGPVWGRRKSWSPPCRHTRRQTWPSASSSSQSSASASTAPCLARTRTYTVRTAQGVARMHVHNHDTEWKICCAQYIPSKEKEKKPERNKVTNSHKIHRNIGHRL